MAEKLNLNKYINWLDLVEMKKESRKQTSESWSLIVDTERKLAAGEPILDIKAKWPMIIGSSGNETNLHCFFLVKIRPGAPDEAVKIYQAALK
jgi:hypothetical protein